LVSYLRHANTVEADREAVGGDAGRSRFGQDAKPYLVRLLLVAVTRLRKETSDDG
jgi:hypothetical protein